MTHAPRIHRSRQAGYSLAEILVATAIFAVIMLAAFMIYDQSNKIFKTSNEAADMQQSTRVAFDKLTGDIRMAGYDFDRDGRPMSSLATPWKPNTTYTAGSLVQPDPPNGHTYVATAGGLSNASPPVWLTTSKVQVKEAAPSTLIWQETDNIQYQQPDEQIEYAGATAITIRGNFDFESDAAKDNGREGKDSVPNLETEQFKVVTTGNDEIVTYALQSANAAKNTGTITFYADTNVPRSVHPGNRNKENTVTISGVDLTNANPPYTLYRYTLDPTSARPVGTPLADNIRSLTFKYYSDLAGTKEITTLPNGDGPYDAAKPDDIVAGRDTRTSIKSIQIALVGMNPQPDASFKDTTDTVAPTYRKYELTSMIVPRNLGRRGMQEFSTTAPQAPTLESVCAGACNAVYLTWAAPAAGGAVDSYSILYDTDCTGGFPYSEDAGQNLDGYAGRKIEPGKKWYFAVQAINKWGAATSNCIGIDVENRTTPAAVTDFDASGGDDATYVALENKIELKWPSLIGNDSSAREAICSGGTSMTQATMPLAEKRYFRVYRSRRVDFEIDDTDVERVLDEGSPTQPTLNVDNETWLDTKAANCTPYYYRIQVVDYCARDKSMNSTNNAGQAIGPVFPAETDPAIKGMANRTTAGITPVKPTSLTKKSDSCNAFQCDVTLTWNPVTKDTAGNTIAIDKYTIRAWKKNIVNGTWASFTPTWSDVTNGATEKTLTIDRLAEWMFTVSATDCAEGPQSDPMYYPCSFNGGAITVSIPTIYGGAGTQADPWIVEPPATVSVNTANNVKQIEISVFQNDVQVGTTTTATGTIKTATASLPDTSDGVPARIRILVTDSNNCTMYADRYVLDQPAPSCSLIDRNSDPTVVSWTSGSNNVNIKVKNSSAEQLTLEKIIIGWDTGVGEELDTVNFPGGGVVATNCTLATTTVTAPAGTSKVAANDTTYTITTTFDLKGNKKLSKNPINSVCVVYRTTTGDRKVCSIAPNFGTCTEPTGAACQ
ncbi:MAG TPA: prepilin-type N-terminal cleavage/methylation domain-containing protein [Thermoanaerobaculia bacterium]